MVVPTAQVLTPALLTVNVAYWLAVVGAILKPAVQELVVPKVKPSTVNAVYVAVPVSASVTLHSLIAVTRAFLPWFTFAL